MHCQEGRVAMAEGLDDEQDRSMSYDGDVSCIANCLSICTCMHACMYAHALYLTT